jgi:putative salt-induced outer membrane protein
VRRFEIAALITILIVLAGTGYADDKKQKDNKRFSNQTSFSLVNTTGNTETLSLSGENEMSYAFSDAWTGSWLLGAIYKENDSEKESERYYTDLRADYFFTDRWYTYGLGSWYRDQFSGFDNRIGIGPGLGYKFLKGPRHLLLFEIGADYTYEDYTDELEDNRQFLEGRFFGNYEWAFTEKTKFSQSLEYLQSLEDSATWKFNSKTALITALTDILALKVSYSVFYNNDPRPSDLKDTDTLFTTSLVISF